jgi:hypothetical protein
MLIPANRDLILYFEFKARYDSHRLEWLRWLAFQEKFRSPKNQEQLTETWKSRLSINQPDKLEVRFENRGKQRETQSFFTIHINSRYTLEELLDLLDTFRTIINEHLQNELCEARLMIG